MRIFKIAGSISLFIKHADECRRGRAGASRHAAEPRYSMIPKSGHRFSEKIMVRQ
jgi:hypothetical protein